eukprot:Amastigsp_a340004_160.p1 type:complete len:195 gc:universal Amastigsp_a340004_160:1345-761(-)
MIGLHVLHRLSPCVEVLACPDCLLVDALCFPSVGQTIHVEPRRRNSSIAVQSRIAAASPASSTHSTSSAVYLLIVLSVAHGTRGAPTGQHVTSSRRASSCALSSKRYRATGFSSAWTNASGTAKTPKPRAATELSTCKKMASSPIDRSKAHRPSSNSPGELRRSASGSAVSTSCQCPVEEHEEDENHEHSPALR